MSETVKNFVDKSVSSNKVVVFSKTYCPYCTKAKNVIKKYNIKDISVIELDDHDDCEQIQDYLAKLTGARTVYFCFNQKKKSL
jgi:glutaredoxin 3